MTDRVGDLLDRVARGRADPDLRRRLRWAAVAGGFTLGLGLIAAQIASGNHAAAWTWLSYAACSLAGLASILLFTSAFADDRVRALVVGLSVYLWPVLLFLGIAAVNGRLFSDGLDRIVAGLVWPNWAVQALVACPLNLPCPLGR